MTGKTLIVGAAIAIGAVVLYANRGASRAAVTEPRAETLTVATERSANAPAHVWRSSTQSPQPVGTVDKSDATAEPAPAKARQPAQPKRGQTMIEDFAPIHDVLEAAFAQESHDGAWSMDAQRTAERSLSATLPPRTAIKSIDCRSKLCRIETIHAGYPDARVFVRHLVEPAERPWNGAFYTGPIARDSGTGVVTFVTYLAREGAVMPTIPDPAGDD
jgi:hypothetical protein